LPYVVTLVVLALAAKSRADLARRSTRLGSDARCEAMTVGSGFLGRSSRRGAKISEPARALSKCAAICDAYEADFYFQFYSNCRSS
jgi:hypothetical protein